MEVLNIIIFLFVVFPIAFGIPVSCLLMEYRDFKKEGKAGETFKQFSERNKKQYI